MGVNIPRYIFTYQLSFCCRLPHEYIRSMVLTFGLAFGSSEELKNHRMEYNISGTVTPLDSWCYANQFKIAKVMSTHKKKRFGKGYMLFVVSKSITDSIILLALRQQKAQPHKITSSWFQPN